MISDLYNQESRPDTALQPPAEFEKPGRTMSRVELITGGFHMVCSLELHRAGARLVDFLNFGGEAVLLLHDAEVRALEQKTDGSSHWPTAHIRRDAIILAIPSEERPASPGAERPMEYVEKEPRRVSLVFPTFAVTGDLHLAKQVDINAASPIRGTDFVPLTDAEAIYLARPSLMWKAPIILVNVAKAEVCCPSGDLALQQLS
jgi:hypothetical protein